MKVLSIIGLVFLLLGLGACDKAPTSDTTATATEPQVTEQDAGADTSILDDSEAKVSYIIGYDAAQQLSQQGLKLSVEAYTQGVRDALAGTEPRISQADAEAAMSAMQEELNARAAEQQSSALAQNEAIAAEYLAENAKKDGVTVTESGLQYRVISEGSGPKPAGPQASVQVHYTGRLVNGRVFDSSVERGEPVVFPLNQVIPGWTEGVQLMNEGSKYEFSIPAKLAYGNNAPPSIGPGQALIFEVELLKANAE